MFAVYCEHAVKVRTLTLNYEVPAIQGAYLSISPGDEDENAYVADVTQEHGTLGNTLITWIC